MRPFGCPVTILNTLDPLGKFDGKAEEGFLVGYSVNSKAFRVFNSQTRNVEENLHVKFLENKSNVAGQGANWLFNIDSLTNSMNYQPVTAGNQTNKNVGPQEANGNTDEKYKNDIADDDVGESPVQKLASENEQALKNVLDKMMDQEKEATEQSDAVRKEFEAQCNRGLLQGNATRSSSTNSLNTVGPSFVPLGGSFPLNINDLLDDPLMPDLEDTTEADFNNMEPSTVVSPIPITRVHSIHPKNQIIGDLRSAVQTRGMSKKSSGEHAMISYIQKQRRWMKRKGAGTQREYLICYGQFIMKLANEVRVLRDEVIRNLSAPIYCRDLDTTTLKELIDFEGRLIPEDPQPDVPRVAIPRAQRASIQDLYERMGSIEIRQGAIERMAYRQSYHWDMYARVFEHMAGVYSVPL
ncbi:hypothetical protein Tco_0474211 [Tanacetum coccineum]